MKKQIKTPQPDTKRFWLRVKTIALFCIMGCLLACDSDDDDNGPGFVVDFTYLVNQQTGTVTFINTSSQPAVYDWDFGDGEQSNEINPVKTYANGTYRVSLGALFENGTSNSVEYELTIFVSPMAALPITFDQDSVEYDFDVFNGAAFEIVANPAQGGTNDKPGNVGAITNQGIAFEGMSLNLGIPLSLASQKQVRMNFWSDEPINVLLKLELGSENDIETVASHGGTGWESIAFNFDSDAAYTKLTLFADGPGTTAGTFYFDDIVQATVEPIGGCLGTPVAAMALPLDFEGCATFPAADNFGAGLTSTLAENPDQSGINTSDFVLQVDKPAGADFFAGIQNTFANNFDLSAADVFKVQLYSTKPNTVFRFELVQNPAMGGNPAPVFRTVTNANEWTEIEFSFSNLPDGPMTYNQLVIKPDNDMADSPISTGGTYYIDNISLATSGPGFDDGLLMNGDFENGTASWIGNALNVLTEGNNSFNFADVAEAGTPFSVNLSQVLNLTEGTDYILTFDASSDRNRTMVAGIGLNVVPFTNTSDSVDLTTTMQTFTLSLNATGFGGPDSRVLFDMGAAVGTVVIDNVSLKVDNNGGGNPGNNLATNGDFETGDGTGWAIFDNGGTAALDNTVSESGTWSGRLATSGASNPGLKQERIGGGTVSAGDVVQVQFDHIGEVVQPGAVFNVILFGESSGGVSFTQVLNPGPVLSNSWTNYSATFTIPDVAVDEGLSLLIEAVCGGDAGCSVAANIDNVSVTLNP